MSVVFWDFDGTLAYSESLWSGSVYKALLETDATTSVPFTDIKKHKSGYSGRKECWYENDSCA